MMENKYWILFAVVTNLISLLVTQEVTTRLWLSSSSTDSSSSSAITTSTSLASSSTPLTSSALELFSVRARHLQDDECCACPSPAPSSVNDATGDFADALTACLTDFAAYSQCVLQNGLECGACILPNLPNDPNAGFCELAESTLCGFGACCDECDSEFDKFDACFQQVVSEVTLGLCDIDCDSFVPPPSDPLDNFCVDKLEPYSQCIQDNFIECGACAILSVPGNPNEIGFCDAAADTICGFSQCCESCATEFQEFDECFEDFVSAATLGQCQIDCDTWTLSEDATTVQGCLDTLQEYGDCVLANPFQCATCLITNIPAPGQDPICKIASDTICGFGNCCDPCAAEFDKFDDCFETFASTVSFGTCQVDCSKVTRGAGTDPEELWGDRALLRVEDGQEQ